MYVSYIFISLAVIGLLIGLFTQAAGMYYIIMLLFLAFSVMSLEHFKNQRQTLEQLKQIELNQRSLMILLNEKKDGSN